MMILGVDYGRKRIGLAIGQSVTKTSSPLIVLKNNSELFSGLDKVFKDWNPNILVIGKPVFKDGNVHPLEKHIEKFTKKLIFRYNVRKVYRVNESYSSVEAEYHVHSKAVDAHAAAIILESWMGENFN